jgi:ubiquinone/menaquinone biosynthesis C-methylase UbiE
MITDDFDYLAPGGRSFTITSGLISKLSERSRVLEIAAGKGEAACALAAEFNCIVDAFDIDPIMVEYAREKAKALGLSENINFEVKDGREMDFGNGKYDMVLAEGGALTYIGREEGVERCSEILKENGCLALLDLIYLREDVPRVVRDAYEEGVYSYLTEIGYRELLERYSFEIIHLSIVPQSAWDRYYMSMKRKISDPKGNISKEFKDSMEREIDVYYNMGGIFNVGYIYIVARLAKEKRVEEAPDDMRIPIMGVLRS